MSNSPILTKIRLKHLIYRARAHQPIFGGGKQNATTPRYEPCPIRVTPSVNWRRRVLVTASSNSTSLSGAPDERTLAQSGPGLFAERGTCG